MASVKRKISVIGLGYVGLPVAIAFSEAGFDVLGYDINASRVKELNAGEDGTFEIRKKRLHNHHITYSNNKEDIRKADFHIISVPTPVTKSNSPDISQLTLASEIVGQQLKIGDIVIYESTVYPGCTEDECIPVLEKQSNLRAGIDFFVGYSPERINPGDPNHRFEKILKIVAAQCPKSLNIIANTYAAVVTAGVYRAPSIRVAEAAKVIENTQRDLNIGFINELSKIFNRMGIDTYDVLDAAGTKWNFNLFEPGLVGGHCIGVDPYYLTSKAIEVGIEPKVILSGRDTNNNYPIFIAEQCELWLKSCGITRPKIMQLGITFKENVPDIRNSRALDLACELGKIDPTLLVVDPFVNKTDIPHQLRFSSRVTDESFDVIVLAVPHTKFIAKKWGLLNPSLTGSKKVLVMDIKGKLERSSKPETVSLWRP